MRARRLLLGVAVSLKAALYGICLCEHEIHRGVSSSPFRGTLHAVESVLSCCGCHDDSLAQQPRRASTSASRSAERPPPE